MVTAFSGMEITLKQYPWIHSIDTSGYKALCIPEVRSTNTSAYNFLPLYVWPETLFLLPGLFTPKIHSTITSAYNTLPLRCVSLHAIPLTQLFTP